jgi:hypothetical protein
LKGYGVAELEQGVPSHTVTVMLAGKAQHVAGAGGSVTVAGDGSMQHVLQAFRAGLLAAGFSAADAARLGLMPPGAAE